jgi:hypothetical protein
MSFRRESEMREPVVRWLADRDFLAATEILLGGFIDIVAGKYGERPSPRRRPPLLDAMAIELKLTDVAGVIAQAATNACDLRSYCAMPAFRCGIMRAGTVEKFRLAGVGLLSVGEWVEVIVPAPRFVGPLGQRINDKIWRQVRRVYDARANWEELVK